MLEVWPQNNNVRVILENEKVLVPCTVAIIAINIIVAGFPLQVIFIIKIFFFCFKGHLVHAEVPIFICNVHTYFVLLFLSKVQRLYINWVITVIVLRVIIPWFIWSELPDNFLWPNTDELIPIVTFHNKNRTSLNEMEATWIARVSFFR